jgi:hypothetical protein
MLAPVVVTVQYQNWLKLLPLGSSFETEECQVLP